MDFRKLSYHLIAVALLLGVTAVIFAPNVFQGKVLPQPDNDKARAMQTEIQYYVQKEDKAPLWTNSAFGGMPAYQIYNPVHGNLTIPVYKAIFLGSDYTSVWVQVFVAMLCMYLFLSVLQLDWRIGIFGALAFGITSYNVDIIEAGHSTKMAALALTPGIFAGLVLLLRGRLLLGLGLTALFTAVQLYANHVQITYYALLLGGLYFLAHFFSSLRQKELLQWAKAAGLAVLALGIGFASNTSKLWPTYEYSQETIRGKSELSVKSEKGDGLDKDYLFGWSYGIGESLTLLVPHYAGGGAGETFNKTELYNTVQPQMRRQIGGLFYNGEQPFVGTAIYFGAIVILLFFVGAILATGAARWWLLGGGLFMLTLAWGKHFFLNDVWYDYLPLFNKFRAVSMALGPAQLCFAALAALGLQRLTDKSIDPAIRRNALYAGGGITAFLCMVAWFTGAGSGPNDAMLAEQNQQMLDIVQSDRRAMLNSDVLRSLLFIGAAMGLIWLYLKGQLKAAVLIPAIAVLALFDHWMVTTRTLSFDKYVSERTAIAAPQPLPYDNEIRKDPDIHYRVLDLSRGSITSNWVTSYFHKSLGGYHAAKLQRYQEVVDAYLNTNLGSSLHIVGMLNGKYIVNQNGEVFTNPQALGNAWFVKHVRVVPDGDTELRALETLNPADTAVVQEAFASEVQNLNIQPDSNASIQLTAYHPDKMEYSYSAATDQIAVFSEIYYPAAKGWKCYLNGEPGPDFFKADYLLRAMRLPAGQNMKLEMRFEPQSYYLGEKISLFASALVLLALALALFFWYRAGQVEDPNRLSDIEKEEKTRPTAIPVSRKAPKGRKK